MEGIPQTGSLANPKQRFTEWAKFLPVAFVSSNIIGLYLIYTFLHAMPRVFSDHHHARGVTELVAFSAVTLLLVTCYLWCILVHPGTIPEKEEDPSWEYVPHDIREASLDSGLNPQEWKRTGDRRCCKWCAKYKPDRCHHCRVCRMCILKMDHHCPWIYNCVGFKNHKYFFLLLFYTTIDLNIIFWTMLESVKAALNPSTPFLKMFLLLFGESLAGFLGCMMTAFFCFHIYLMSRAMTTIEFCEKAVKRSGYDANIYDRGCLGNVKAVLGDNPFLWPLPCSPPPGRGLSFVTEDMRLTRDMEVGRNVRRKAHQQSEVVKRRSARPHTSGGTGSAPGSGASEDESESSEHRGFDDPDKGSAAPDSRQRLPPSP